MKSKKKSNWKKILNAKKAQIRKKLILEGKWILKQKNHGDKSKYNRKKQLEAITESLD